MTRIPMPSPLGSNTEQLYLPPRLAQDAARRANDASPAAEAMSELQQFLETTLGPDDARRAEDLLNALLEAITPDDSDGDPDDDQAADRRRRMAGDRVVRIRREAARLSFDAHQRTEDEMSRLFPDAVMPRRA